MAHVTEHVAAASALGTGLLTFFRILPETLGCILSVCGIAWYILQMISHLRRERELKERHLRRLNDKEDTE